MACDLQGTIGGAIKLKLHTKIWQYPPVPELWDKGSFFMGMAGSAEEMIEVSDWMNDPSAWKAVPRMKGSQGLVLTDSKEIFYFSSAGKWLRVKTKYFAIGSGAPSALGALSVGASPKEAVLAAGKVDPNTGMGTRVLTFAHD